MTSFIYVYCHGLLSSPQSEKGKLLKAKLKANYDIDLIILDYLVNDDITSVTFCRAFDALNRLWEAGSLNNKKFRLLGSSLGGQIAATYAAMHPNRVDSLFLLCPAFNTYNTTKRVASSLMAYGSDAVETWKSQGYLEFPVPYRQEKKAKLPYSFLEQCNTVPAYPKYKCRAFILIGTKDTVVTVDDIDTFLSENSDQKALTSVHKIEDDHYLTAPTTLSDIVPLIAEFFNLQ